MDEDIENTENYFGMDGNMDLMDEEEIPKAIESSKTSNGLVETEVNSTSSEPSDKSKATALKFTQLPLARIKSIMKMDPDVNLASSEAVFAVTKATELFIQSIAQEAYSYTAKGKRKIITKKDLDAVIDTLDCLCFLEGALDL